MFGASATFMNRIRNRLSRWRPTSGRSQVFAVRSQEHLQHLNPELVELTGIEPVASWLQTRRSPS
jgi:hypothetical protein